MADQLKLDPYQSQVPIVQAPLAVPGDTTPAKPLQGQFGAKGTGALAIGDSIVKGFLQGHAMLAERKAKEANATISAAQGAESGAWGQYQDALAQGKAKADASDPFYQTYLKAHQNASTVMEQFTIPPKGSTTKGQKKDQKKAEGDEAKPQTFGERMKDFIQANPHIIPQLAIASRVPNPPTMTPGTQEASQKIKAAQSNEALTDIDVQEAQKQAKYKQAYVDGVPVYGHLTEQEITALPPDAKKSYDAWLSAKAAITPIRSTGAMSTYIDSNGNPVKAYPGEEPAGSKLYVAGLTTKPFKPGSYEEFASNAQNGYGIKPGQQIPPELDKYLHDWWSWKQSQQTSSTSTSTTDVAGNRTTQNSASRGAPPPKPPAGMAPVEDQLREKQTGGGIAPPPASRSATATPHGTPGISAPPSARSSGGIAPPPGSQPTLTEANRTMKVETQKSDRYQKATTAYQKTISDAQKQVAAGKQDQGWLDAQNKKATENLANEKVEVGKWYAQQIRATGGQVNYHARKNPKTGQVIETNDGINWRDVITGQPVR